MLKKAMKIFEERVSVNILCKVALVVLIVYLIINTYGFWGHGLSLFITILQPFVVGFALAFIIHPIIEYFDKWRIPKALTITMLWVTIILGTILLILFLLPAIYNRTVDLAASLVGGVKGISDYLMQIGTFQDFSLVNSITDYINSFVEDLNTIIPQIVGALPNVMSKTVGVITNVTFSIIIAIYMCIDYNRICTFIMRVFTFLHPSASFYIHEINQDVGVYIRSLFILMLIKFIEYSTFYYLIGHSDWMIIGVLMAFGIFIPYIGGTIGNVIGVITGLTMAPIRVVLLLLGIAILSNLDAYVIAPKVHKKRSDLGVILSLFAVFAGGILYSGMGIMVSIPLTIAIKSFYETYRERHAKKTN